MNRFWKAVLLTALVAGTLDIIAAHVDHTIRTGVFPAKMFYVIAGGAIGLKNAFTNGWTVIVLGVLIHYFISFCFTLFFFLVHPVVKRVSPNKYLNGCLYALFVWLTMNFVVLPLTALPQKPFVFNIDALVGYFVLTAAFGMPISIMTDKYYKIGAGEEKLETLEPGGAM